MMQVFQTYNLYSNLLNGLCVRGIDLNPFSHGLSDQRLVMEGPKRPPLDIWLSEDIFINFLYIYLYLDVKA